MPGALNEQQHDRQMVGKIFFAAKDRKTDFVDQQMDQLMHDTEFGIGKDELLQFRVRIVDGRFLGHCREKTKSKQSYREKKKMLCWSDDPLKAWHLPHESASPVTGERKIRIAVKKHCYINGLINKCAMRPEISRDCV
jgi:hypothetical protein